MRPRPDGPRGFTIVELLIVISIIALLTAILTPSLMLARAHARLVLCQMQLRSQAQAHGLYAADNEQNKPPLLRKGRTIVRKDWASPDVKWVGTPVGQGLLVVAGYLEFDNLLCPASSMTRDADLDRNGWEKLMS